MFKKRQRKKRPKFESVARNLIKIFPRASERPKFKPFTQNLVNIFPITALQLLLMLFFAEIRNFPTIKSVPSRSPLSTSRESHRRALRVHSIRYEMFKCIFQITHYHYVFWLRNVINVLELLFQSVAPKIRNK